jgi:hypothetical protein
VSKQDSRGLANLIVTNDEKDLARVDRIPKCYIPDKEIIDIRSLARHRIELVEGYGWKNKVQSNR